MGFPQPIELSTDEALLPPTGAQGFPKGEPLAAIEETQTIHTSTTPYYN